MQETHDYQVYSHSCKCANSILGSIHTDPFPGRSPDIHAGNKSPLTHGINRTSEGTYKCRTPAIYTKKTLSNIIISRHGPPTNAQGDEKPMCLAKLSPMINHHESSYLVYFMSRDARLKWVTALQFSQRLVSIVFSQKKNICSLSELVNSLSPAEIGSLSQHGILMGLPFRQGLQAASANYCMHPSNPSSQMCKTRG